MPAGPTASGVDTRRRRCIAALAAPWAVAAVAQPGRVTVVGSGERRRTLHDAVRAAEDGDTLLLQPGAYVGDTAVVEQPRLTIRGLGGGDDGPGVVLRADGRHAEGKALLVVRGGDVVVDNVAFRGSRVPGGNGAGIRFERGRLAVSRCDFFDNEMGILTANQPELVLAVDRCRFGDAPRHEGALHHLLYAGTIDRLTLTRCRFGNGWRGHLVKSRARHSEVRDNLLIDAPEGEASYELEFPNGGHARVVGNVIVQSARTQNPDIVSIGAEGGGTGVDCSLSMAHNTVVNRAGPEAAFVRVWADRLPQATPVRLANNLFVGDGALVLPPGHDAGGNRQGAASLLRDPGGGDFRLAAGSPWRGRAVAVDDALRPAVAAGRGALRPGSWSPGALQPAD